MKLFLLRSQQVMKLFLLIFCTIVSLTNVLLAETAHAQYLEKQVSVRFKKDNAWTAIQRLEEEDIRFAYDARTLGLATKKVADMDFNSRSVAEVLRYIFSGTDITFNESKGYITLKRLPKPGRISGKVLDETGLPLPGATIKLVEAGKVLVSRVDGTYTIEAVPGAYTLEVNFIGYQPQRIINVVVAEGSLTSLTIAMKPVASSLKEVVVTSSYKRASIEGLYARQKNSANVTDGISAEQVARTPDKNIGESLKRISGLTTIDNKYVVVRGLSERYNQAVLNDQAMPSTELNRKQFSFDIIPAGMVDNVTVLKTITPDKSAEFGGGTVQVSTKDIPDENFTTFSAGTAINDKTMGKPFLTMALDNNSYLGGVAKSRYLFGRLDWHTGLDAAAYYKANGSNPNSISNNWGISRMTAQPSQNYQLTLGRVLKGKDAAEWGIIASAAYRNTQNRVDVRTSQEGWNAPGSGTDALLGAYAERYDFNTSLSGLVAAGYRKGHNKISAQSLYLRNLSQPLTEIYKGSALDGNGNFGLYDMTTQTSLWQNQLKGEHQLSNSGIKLNWLANYTYLNKLRPDNHISFATVPVDETVPDQSDIVTRGSGSLYGLNRWWERAMEKNLSWDAALSLPFSLWGSKQQFKTGYAGWRKDRLFYVLNSSSDSQGASFGTTPLADLFGPDYLKSIDFVKYGDSLHKVAFLHAFYGMMDNQLGKKLRLVWGARAEYFNAGDQNTYLDYLEKAYHFDYSAYRRREKSLHIFPSTNLTYHLTDKMNVRLAYARSIIRPDLREMAFFHEYDYELGGEYGGANVRSTMLDNFDLRYEWYSGTGDVFTVSGFYKHIDYPLEVFALPNRLFVLENSREAKNYGVEAELRRSLSFIDVPVVRNLTLFGNATWMDAQTRPMKLSESSDPANTSIKAPVEIPLDWEHRPQAGAANRIYNAGIYYDTKMISATLVYNAISKRILRLGSDQLSPNKPSDNYYEQPAQSLDAQLALRLMRRKLEVKLNVSNLLNSYYIIYLNRENTDENGNLSEAKASYQSSDQTIYRANSGRTYGITLTLNL